MNVPLFARSKEPADETCRRYLAIAPRGPRTEVLTAASIYQVQHIPIASADRFGNAVTVADVTPAAAVVRDVLFQDRDITGPIARKVMQHLQAIVSNFMKGPVGENIDTFLQSLGLEMSDGDIVMSSPGRDRLSAGEAGAAESLANVAFAVFRAFTLGEDALPAERRLYVELHTGAADKDVEELAYDIIGWTAIGLGRLFNTNRIRPGLPTADPAYRHAPRMEVEGWYPNPQRTGDIVDGNASIQRYWNSERWTDQVRIREGRGWKSVTASLHDAPVD
jgi:hypothetical protein